MKITCLIIFLFGSIMNNPTEKDLIYKALSGKSLQKIETLITSFQTKKDSPNNRAYKGALLAKKAEFIKPAQKKISSFKKGVQLLETEIKLAPNHTEYRFLRLCIQEHCPAILKYNNNIDEDVLLITNTYTQQSKNLKRIILEYAKNSNTIDHTLLK